MKNRLFTIVLILSFFSPSMLNAQRSYTLSNITAGRNEKVSGLINVSTGTKGPEIKIPVTVLNGQFDGPVIVLSASVQSRETQPIAALQRIEDELDTNDLYGTVVILRIVRRKSFLSRTIYHSPPEGVNLNRVYPGKISGSISERISYRLTKEVIEECDYLVDISCNEQNDELIPLVYCTEIGNPFLVSMSEDMARHTAFDVVVNRAFRPEKLDATVSLSVRALFRGKPAITIESGRQGDVDFNRADDIVQAIFGIMRKFDMLSGTPRLNSDQFWVSGKDIVRSEYGGLFSTTVSQGEYVSEGEQIGLITDNAGYVYQTILAKAPGKALYVRKAGEVEAGTALVLIGIIPESSEH